MCGLFASIGLRPDPARIDIVAHRGPDGRGWHILNCATGPVALGHRRLAIIDVSDAGAQPMSDTSGRYHLVFNGEIYNYIELRDDLVAKGEQFFTQSDTEVLLRAFMVWGEAALPRLRGMFAFAIWDDKTKRLFAARDRFGIKPLYIARGPQSIALASEIKQLVGLPGVTGRMNMARVRDFLASGLTDHTAETLFDGVNQLRAGEHISIDAASPKLALTLKRWYSPPTASLSLSSEEATTRFVELLTQSLKIHLRSDVPVGSCLSGGLDSSAIVSLMSRMMPEGVKVNTVSACYTEQRVNEKPFIDAVVAWAGTNSHIVYPSADDLFQRASDVVWHQDEPFGSTSIFAQWCVFDGARRAGIRVMLDGQGADEQLAGYHSAFAYHLAGLIRQLRLIEAASVVSRRRGAQRVTEQLTQSAVALAPKGLIELIRRQRLRSGHHGWLNTEPLNRAAEHGHAVDHACADLGLDRPTDIASLCLAMTFASNLQMLLHWEDRNSMAHSIEARVPFLDHPLVEFTLALGNNHKIVGTETKHVLRHAMKDALPEVVRTRSDKLGFATPEQEWFCGPLRGAVSEGLAATMRRFPDLINATGVQRLTDAMLDGQRPFDFTLWRIICLGIWGERLRVTM